MEQQRQLYPIGIQTFSEIRRKNYLYIDKTEYVYRMTHFDSKSESSSPLWQESAHQHTAFLF